MSDQIARIVEQVTAPWKRRVRLMVLRAVVKMVEDEGKFQRVQLSKLAGVDDDDIENLQPYGFWSVPLSGSEALVFTVGGMSDNAVVGVIADRRYRPTGNQPGESGLHFKDKVLVRCTGPDSDPELHLGAKIATDRVARSSRVDAELSALRNTVNALVNAFNSHGHAVATTGTASAQTGTAAPVVTPAVPPANTTTVASSNVKVNP